MGLVSLARGTEARAAVTDIDSFFGNVERKAIVQYADSIEVSLLTPKNPQADLPSFSFADYTVKERFVASEGLRKELVALLLNSSIYRWPDQRMPDGTLTRLLPLGWYGYHIRLTIRSGRRLVDFGVSCYSIIAIVEGEKVVSTALYGANGDFLFKLCRSMFPADSRLLYLAKTRATGVRDPDEKRR